jgi:glycosyltransferase involved in cell wall biosynthesis
MSTKMNTVSRPRPFTLSVVVPSYNEASHLKDFIACLRNTLSGITSSYEIIIVNDGSKDNTRQVALEALSQGSIRYIEFSRNFGKEAALMAGIDYAGGDAALLIDADFQHPLEKIQEMQQLWRQGYEMIYGVINSRQKESILKKIGTNLFYKILKFSEVPIPKNAGDFRWLDRKVIDALKSLPERNRFMKGLYAWVGFKTIALPFVPNDREGGVSSFSIRNLSKLALSGITSFSVFPLHIWTFVGAIISLLAIAYGIYVGMKTIFYGNAVSGWPTLTVALMFFSGVQLFSVGILGEYIGRIFGEVKQRPLYIVADDQKST